MQQFAAAAKLAPVNMSPGMPGMGVKGNGTAPFAPSGTMRVGNFSVTGPGIAVQTVNAAPSGSILTGAGVAGVIAAVGFMAL